jgi:LacI family transcriptional regulator, repressor for deo operon, udp, cdd, tsx, nupC, and nupG
MSVVGIDDHPLAELCDLTAVRQPAIQQGVRSARLALELLGGDPVHEPYQTLPTHLVIRSTSGPRDPGYGADAAAAASSSTATATGGAGPPALA